MLTWDDRPGPAGAEAGASYETWVPHWGDACVHPSADHPDEMLLECPGLGLHRYSLGRVAAMDALDPAEMALMRALEERGVWCLEAMVAIGGTEG